MLVTHGGSSTEAAGLNCFAPNVNLFRDPRWGRGQETLSEDPYVISVLGKAYTLGLQKGLHDDSNYLKIAACAKHYAVHSGPEETRLDFAANITIHDLYDTYLPAFKSQVMGANVSQVMPAYSGLNCSRQNDSAPDTANTFLLKTILREEFSATNVSVCSDNGGVAGVYNGHQYVDSKEMAAAVCMNATTDLDLGFDYIYTDNLQSAVEHGLVDEDTIRQSVTRNFYLRMRVGDFDPPSKVSYQHLDRTNLDTSYNREINVKAASESIVLLKRTKLPLKFNFSAPMKRVAVIGPNANNRTVMLSSYEGIPSHVVTVLEGVQNYLKNTSSVEYAQGCDVLCADMSDFAGAQTLARQADHVIMVMGLSDDLESENHDRKQTMCEGHQVPLLGLPGCQLSLVESIAKITDVVLVLINGGPISIPTLHEHDGVVGIIEAFYPGAVGGTAVADVIFGKYNPGGKMPVSVYSSTEDLPPVDSYDMSSSVHPGRTYRYSARTPLYPFGYGLSYSDFVYMNISAPNTLKPCEDLVVSVVVGNISPHFAGDEVVMVYMQTSQENLQRHSFFPRTRLVWFRRFHLLPGSDKLVSIVITPYLMSLVGSDGVHYTYPGVYTLMVGGIKTGVTITGDEPVVCSNSPQCMVC
jgi:beta-glucosidase